MTTNERVKQIKERMDEWAAKDIPQEEWENWVSQEIAEQINEAMAEAEQRAGRLEAALRMVEWKASGAHLQCLWCHQIQMYGHRANCPRQQALAQQQAEEK